MAHEVRPLPFKPHRLDGLSERLLTSHYENNYGGAVRRLNAIEGRLAGLDPSTAPSFDLNGLGRDRLIAANSMICTRSISPASAAQARSAPPWPTSSPATSAPSTGGVRNSPPWAARSPAARAGF
jgi:hypothetical protein